MTEQAARWLRVSSEAQDEQNQAPDITGHITGHGYTDTGLSYGGADLSAFHGDQQAEMDRALADARAGKFTVLVAWHVDRIDRRGPWAVGAFVGAMNALGVRVETAHDGVISDRDLSGLVRQWQAREESEHKAERVRIAHSARRARGAVTGRLPWGYESVCTIDGTVHCGNKQHDKYAAPTETGRAYVKDIYSRAISGQSLRSIAAWLSAETGQPITDYGIRCILTNPIYTGRHAQYGECEALVTADMQEQAIKALRARLRRGQRGSKTAPALLIPRCLDCGGKAYRTATGGKVRGYAYYCRTCRHMVDCAKLDSIVYATVLLLADYDDETEIVWVEGSDSASERAEIKRAMRELDPDDDDYLDKASALRDALRALPDAIPGHFDERPTGRTKAEVIAEARGDRNAMRALLARWGVAFAKDGDYVRVKVNGSPEFRRLLSAAGGNAPDLA